MYASGESYRRELWTHVCVWRLFRIRTTIKVIDVEMYIYIYIYIYIYTRISQHQRKVLLVSAICSLPRGFISFNDRRLRLLRRNIAVVP